MNLTRTLDCEQLSYSEMLLLYPIMALTGFQLTRSTVECSKQVFFFFLSIPELSQSFVAPVPAILDHVAGIQFKMSEYLHKNNTVNQFEH